MTICAGNKHNLCKFLSFYLEKVLRKLKKCSEYAKISVTRFSFLLKFSYRMNVLMAYYIFLTVVVLRFFIYLN